MDGIAGPTDKCNVLPVNIVAEQSVQSTEPAPLITAFEDLRLALGV